MKLKRLLLRGATGLLLATGTVGVAVATTAAPAQAVTCDSLEADYNLYISNAENAFRRGVAFAASGFFGQAEKEFGYSRGWYASANSVARC